MKYLLLLMLFLFACSEESVANEEIKEEEPKFNHITSTMKDNEGREYKTDQAI